MQGKGITDGLGSRTPHEAAPAEQADELFGMANLFPRTTGLPMTTWVSPRGNAQHLWPRSACTELWVSPALHQHWTIEP
jgi:hypothetical protein